MILDGRKIANRILNNLKKEIEKKELKLKLAVVLVGDDKQSKIYVKKKKEAAQEIGIFFELFKFSKKIKEKKLLEEIKKIVKKNITGIVVQLPLPENIDTERVLKAIPKEKDVEGFVSSRESPVVCAVSRILKEYKISLKNKKIVLIGRGRLVGKPIAEWLRKHNLEFFNIDQIKKADIIISGAGKPGLISGSMVKKGVVMIDVGGDLDFESVAEKAEYITPVIGGVGPMTVACLLKNLVKK